MAAKKKAKTDEKQKLEEIPVETVEDVEKLAKEVEENLPKESINRTVVIENDKVYVSGSIKLGLKNYSTISIDFGVTKILNPDDDINAVSDSIFNQNILPKVVEFSKKLANLGLKMADNIESFTKKNNNKRYYSDRR